jgi:glycosyltransferase involved in cell wall biosynthesis
MNPESVAPETRAEVEPRAIVPQRSILVSVIIPAYNAAAHVVRALNSVLLQTHRDFEIILINDGSPDTDSLERAIAPYAASIRYHKQQNRGPSGARNVGVLAAHGKYVAFLDSDDAWFSEHLAQQIAMLQADPSLDLVYSDSILMEGDKLVGHAFGSEPQSPPVTFEALLTEACTIATSSAVASRQALMDAGLFDERFRRCEDFDLWLRMSARGCRMDYWPQPSLYHYRTPNSLASDAYLLKRARIEVYEKALSAIPLTASQSKLVRGLIAKTEAKCHKDMAKKFLGCGDYATALKEARRANDCEAHWKIELAVIGLRTMPRAFRYGQVAYQRALTLLSRVRRRKSVRKLQRFYALS